MSPTNALQIVKGNVGDASPEIVAAAWQRLEDFVANHRRIRRREHDNHQARQQRMAISRGWLSGVWS
jgi:hypothetical protein